MGAPKLSDAMYRLLQGTPWGAVGFPPRPNPPPPAADGRTACLRILRRFISELTFFREGDVDRATGKRGSPIPFQLPLRDIHIEWPDNETDLVFPSIIFLSGGTATYDTIGFVSYVEEATRDIYAPGTVIAWMGEYVENLIIEIWTAKKAERRAILAGLEAAMSPTEQMYGLRFRVPEYFNQLVSYSLDTREIADEPDSALNRRRARLNVDMRFTQVSLVNYTPVIVEAAVAVDADPQTGALIELQEPEATDPRIKLAADAGVPLGVEPCDPFARKC